MYQAINAVESAPEGFSPALAAPHALVLQPTGNLDSTTCQGFKELVDVALKQALSGVMIDFLWVEAVDDAGIQTLLFALEQAAKLGKTVSFTTMKFPIRRAVEAQWKQQQENRLGCWQDLFSPDLEQFLEGYEVNLGNG